MNCPICGSFMKRINEEYIRRDNTGRCAQMRVTHRCANEDCQCEQEKQIGDSWFENYAQAH